MIDDKYYCSGTNFEIINCPSFDRESKKCRGIGIDAVYCKDAKNCLLKSHLIHLSALIGITSPGSAVEVGAKCCFNSFIINK